MSRTYYKKGEWNALCDICGRKFKSGQLRERWDGLQVCKKDYEERHPSDFIRGRPDDQSVPWTRPEAADTEVTVCRYFDPNITENFYVQLTDAECS